MAKLFDDIEDWFNGTKTKTVKSKSSGGLKSSTSKRNYSSSPKQAATNAIKATNAKLPQVVVKISGSSKGANKAQAHANYIGRHGKVEIEDQDGNKYKGKDEQKILLDGWKAQGMHDKHETGSRREAFHFVFSMPKGTNPEAMKDAVKNLVKEEFEGHQYFLAQHLDTDSPHVHVLVNATNDRGERLNPRKQDLHNYRINFVHKLREQGILATATRRIHRFQAKDGYSQSKLHENLRKGQGVPTKKPPTNAQMKKISNTHAKVAEQYQSYAKSLTSENRELKKEIEKLTKGVAVDKGR
ncbi:relaxase/mobilization nuclease domain-containing protein [Moraxella sp. Tifton1]|uniref:relaxase/mobilization nuclease domain-containing protein n=1 Tax=Moraxella oculi TaxID=2940516 RepID=UPI002010D2EC|nr:relaxase/mobilization nuclease domain-containing protein [Moraxella sp. Tifton1]MCL1624216.1 relaxase/mobilization nuclease domain-containing protein [Moraxella sp. Tifton1]